MMQTEINSLIIKTIGKLKFPISSVKVKFSKSVFYDDNDIGMLSFSSSTTLSYKVKNTYDIECQYNPRSYLTLTFNERNIIESKVTNTIKLMLGGVLKTEPEDVRVRFSVEPKVTYNPPNRVFGGY